MKEGGEGILSSTMEGIVWQPLLVLFFQQYLVMVPCFMGDVLESLTEEHMAWAMEQKVFFVSTAPLSESGHVNCSPKASGCFLFPDHEHFVYADYTGSANETIAHVTENGRILIMFCSFEGPPRIMRLHGQGRVILPGDAEFDAFRSQLSDHKGLRSFIEVTITRASVSCGFSVPLFDFVGHRETLDKWADSKGAEELEDYRALKNSVSIDGLPGFEQLRPKK